MRESLTSLNTDPGFRCAQSGLRLAALNPGYGSLARPKSKVTPEMIKAAMEKYWLFDVRDPQEMSRDMMREILKAARFKG
jgi:hypothetical protein